MFCSSTHLYGAQIALSTPAVGEVDVLEKCTKTGITAPAEYGLGCGRSVRSRTWYHLRYYLATCHCQQSVSTTFLLMLTIMCVISSRLIPSDGQPINVG